MTYALVRNDTIEATLGRLPDAAVTLTDGRWVKVREGTVVEQQECGYYEVVEVERPADTPTATHDRSVALVNGTPTVVWTQRPKTAEELAAEADQEARQGRETNLSGAISTLRTWSDQAASTNVTQGNAVATLQTVVTRLGVFFDRFADLLENRQ